ncbi:hypothetical protein MRB53_039249 [Persea americana]|nr:hypothetical protein MRB53_039249 [Persea americana]
MTLMSVSSCWACAAAARSTSEERMIMLRDEKGSPRELTAQRVGASHRDQAVWCPLFVYAVSTLSSIASRIVIATDNGCGEPWHGHRPDSHTSESSIEWTEGARCRKLVVRTCRRSFR